MHKGHIGFALEVARLCGLREVIFLPERAPRGKVQVGSFAQRVALLEEATMAYVQLSVLVLDEGRFAVQQTLPVLAEHFDGDELTLLMGSDVARGLLLWPDVDRLLGMAKLAVGLRTGDSYEELHAILEALPDADYKLTQSPHPAVSSSQVRQR